MPIDTQNERRATLLGTVLPVADGVIRAGDRGMLTWVFRLTGEAGTGGVVAGAGWLAGAAAVSGFMAAASISAGHAAGPTAAAGYTAGAAAAAAYAAGAAATQK
jgi:hypothetical protein